MIQMQTKLDVADNSGARLLQCIKVLGGSKRKTASVGDVIVVSIKEAIPRGIASLIETTITSPTEAVLRLLPPNTLIHCNNLAPELSATSNFVCI